MISKIILLNNFKDYPIEFQINYVWALALIICIIVIALILCCGYIHLAHIKKIEMDSERELERKLKKDAFEQEKFWKFIQLSQIDKDAEIKKLAEAMAKDMASDKFNDRLKDLDFTLKQKELDWYKKFTEETKDKK